ncbi:hypothetical protein U1Q18_017492, partial [Sarracenia purpurea var. burkii]
GLVRDHLSTEDIQNAMISERIQGIKVRSLEDHKALLVFSNLEEKVAFMSSDRDRLDQWFEALYDWSYREANVSRRVWVSIVGVPLHSWNRDTFERVGALWGEILEVNEATILKEDLEAGRVCISTDINSIIDKVCQLKVGRFLYPIRCTEFHIPPSCLKSMGAGCGLEMKLSCNINPQHRAEEAMVEERLEDPMAYDSEARRDAGVSPLQPLAREVSVDVDFLSRVEETGEGTMSKSSNLNHSIIKGIEASGPANGFTGEAEPPLELQPGIGESRGCLVINTDFISNKDESEKGASPIVLIACYLLVWFLLWWVCIDALSPFVAAVLLGSSSVLLVFASLGWLLLCGGGVGGFLGGGLLVWWGAGWCVGFVCWCCLVGVLAWGGFGGRGVRVASGVAMEGALSCALDPELPRCLVSAAKLTLWQLHFLWAFWLCCICTRKRFCCKGGELLVFAQVAAFYYKDVAVGAACCFGRCGCPMQLLLLGIVHMLVVSPLLQGGTIA